MTTFDPNAPASAGAGVFGLPHSEAEARVVLVPVPFEATTSYGGGAANGPEAILQASCQVDLLDREVGRPYEARIHWRPAAPEIRTWNDHGKAGVRRVRGGETAASTAVDAACESVNDWLDAEVSRLLDAEKIVGTVGGDHGAVFGAVAAHARRHGTLGVLHVDAHCDLRHAYEGFTWSHASILDNVLRECPTVSRLVQVGIRDFCDEEQEVIDASEGRIVAHFDADLQAARFRGEATWAEQCAAIVDALPDDVYVTFDIDGLDPVLCPHTGTPVPGGLTFAEASFLLGTLARSGRRIVGFDLAEVAPGKGDDEWDANVGARLLYKLVGWTLASRE